MSKQTMEALAKAQRIKQERFRFRVRLTAKGRFEEGARAFTLILCDEAPEALETCSLEWVVKAMGSRGYDREVTLNRLCDKAGCSRGKLLKDLTDRQRHMLCELLQTPRREW